MCATATEGSPLVAFQHSNYLFIQFHLYLTTYDEINVNSYQVYDPFSCKFHQYICHTKYLTEHTGNHM